MSQYSLSVLCHVVSLADSVLSGCTVGQLFITCNSLPITNNLRGDKSLIIAMKSMNAADITTQHVKCHVAW